MENVSRRVSCVINVVSKTIVCVYYLGRAREKECEQTKMSKMPPIHMACDLKCMQDEIKRLCEEIFRELNSNPTIQSFEDFRRIGCAIERVVIGLELISRYKDCPMRFMENRPALEKLDKLHMLVGVDTCGVEFTCNVVKHVPTMKAVFSIVSQK